nr:nuclear pore complex protein NUP205 [Tanacetum cinerariifolium]
MPRECLAIIESKSKVRYPRNKPVVAKVSTNTSTSGISPDVAELKDMVNALLLDKKGQNHSPAPVKAVEESCVTCGGPILPETHEGDVKALVVYLCVLRKVVENGNPIERKTWFPDIEPLFKLSYENAPPYLKKGTQRIVDAGIFRFIYDHAIGPFSQSAYADPSEKWQLGVACLQYFQMVIICRILSMYDIKEEDIDLVASQSQLSTPLQMQLPVVELLKELEYGRVAFGLKFEEAMAKSDVNGDNGKSIQTSYDALKEEFVVRKMENGNPRNGLDRDKPSSITWEEKHQRDKPSSEVVNFDTSFLIGLFMDVPIIQELNNAGLVVFTCVNDASSIVFGFAIVGDGMSDAIDYQNNYWNSNEYDDDDDDVGYMRQPIEDETWFLAHEIYYPGDNDIMEKLSYNLVNVLYKL